MRLRRYSTPYGRRQVFLSHSTRSSEAGSVNRAPPLAGELVQGSSGGLLCHNVSWFPSFQGGSEENEVVSMWGWKEGNLDFLVDLEYYWSKDYLCMRWVAYSLGLCVACLWAVWAVCDGLVSGLGVHG